VVYITGSTAFRAQVYNGLVDLGLAAQQGATSSANTFTFAGTVATQLQATSLILPAGLTGAYNDSAPLAVPQKVSIRSSTAEI